MNKHELRDKIAEAIYKNDICEIAKCNLIIREEKIMLTKMEILEAIYWTDCGERYIKAQKISPCMISWADFEGDIVYQYIEKYWNIFDREKSNF